MAEPIIDPADLASRYRGLFAKIMEIPDRGRTFAQRYLANQYEDSVADWALRNITPIEGGEGPLLEGGQGRSYEQYLMDRAASGNTDFRGRDATRANAVARRTPAAQQAFAEQANINLSGSGVSGEAILQNTVKNALLAKFAPGLGRGFVNNAFNQASQDRYIAGDNFQEYGFINDTLKRLRDTYGFLR